MLRISSRLSVLASRPAAVVSLLISIGRREERGTASPCPIPPISPASPSDDDWGMGADFDAQSAKFTAAAAAASAAGGDEAQRLAAKRELLQVASRLGFRPQKAPRRG